MLQIWFSGKSTPLSQQAHQSWIHVVPQANRQSQNPHSFLLVHLQVKSKLEEGKIWQKLKAMFSPGLPYWEASCCTRCLVLMPVIGCWQVLLYNMAALNGWQLSLIQCSKEAGQYIHGSDNMQQFFSRHWTKDSHCKHFGFIKVNQTLLGTVNKVQCRLTLINFRHPHQIILQACISE